VSPRRRPRGSLIDPVGVHWDVERTAKERFSAIARNANVSEAVLFEHVVLTLELTDQGVPTTWTPHSRDGELPIESAWRERPVRRRAEALALPSRSLATDRDSSTSFK